MAELKVFAIDRMPAGIRLPRPVLVASTNIREAAKALRVTRYHLSRHPMPALTDADMARALERPGERILGERRMED